MKKILPWLPALAYLTMMTGACSGEDSTVYRGRGGAGGAGGINGTGGTSGNDGVSGTTYNPSAGRGGMQTGGCGPVVPPEPGETLIGCDGQPIGGRGGTGGSDPDAGDGGPDPDAGSDTDAGDASALDSGQL